MFIEILMIVMTALLAASIAYLWRRRDDRVSMLWGLSWFAIITSIVLSTIDTPVSIVLQCVGETAFAAAIVCAAYAYRERPIPGWVVAAALAVALARSGLRLEGLVVAFHATTVVSFGAAYLLAAALLWRPLKDGRVVVARCLSAAHVAVVVMTAFVSWESAGLESFGLSNTASTNVMVMGTIFGLALTQLMALVDRARLRELRAGRARLGDLELLAALAKLGNTEDHTLSLLRESLSRIAGTLGLEAGGFYLPTEDGDQLELVVRLRDVALPPDVRHIDLDGPLIAHALESHRATFLDDVGDTDERIVRGFRELGVTAGAVIPLVRGDAVLGLLMVARAERRPFGEAEQRLLNAAGEQIAVALQRVRAVEGQAKEAMALRAERRTLRAVLENAPVGVLVEDDQGRIALLNSEMTDQLQVGSLDAWLGRPVGELRTALEGRLGRDSSWPTPDGAPRELVVREPVSRTLIHRARTIRDEDGGIVGRVWISRDATEEHRLETQLHRAQKMETIGTLAGGIAHDFNNQLTAILGNAALLRARAGDPATSDEVLDDLVLSAQHCARLTASLLAFARSDPISKSTVDVASLFDDVVAMLRPILPSSIEVDVQVEPGLPAIMGDPTKLQQVLVNLAVNARDAIDGAGRIGLSASKRRLSRADIPPESRLVPGEHLAISVTDDGVGMDEAHRERIFEPFFTTKEVGKGTGLGLSIVFGAVSSHGGFLDVDTAPGGGTTITAVLPFAEAEEAHPAPAEAVEPQALDRSVTILVAEDEGRVRSWISLLLRAEGYEVIEAHDGGDARQKFAQHRDSIEMVLLDLTMPNGDGFATLAALRHERPGLPAVVMSGYANEEPGSDEIFLAKPFQREDLLDALQRALSQR